MKSPQQHTPTSDFLQATWPVFASAVTRRAACLWVQAQHDPRRILIGFNRQGPVIVDALCLMLLRPSSLHSIS